MTGIIELEDMQFYAYHGCFSEERTIGNVFIVNLYLETDMKKCSQTDDIHDALSYPYIYQLVKDEMDIPSNLVEHVADRVLTSLYKNAKGIKKATVKISKMAPPIGGQVKCFSVTLSR